MINSCRSLFHHYETSPQNNFDWITKEKNGIFSHVLGHQEGERGLVGLRCVVGWAEGASRLGGNSGDDHILTADHACNHFR